MVAVWREGRDPLTPCSSKPALRSSLNPARSVKGTGQLVVGGSGVQVQYQLEDRL